MKSIEVDWAIKQLEAVGDIELSQDRATMRITGQGIKRGFELLRGFRIDELFLIYLLCGEVEGLVGRNE